MSKRTLQIGLAGLVLVAAFLAWRGRGDPDVRAIRRSLDNLVEAAQLENREDLLRAGIRSRAIGSFFVEDAVITSASYRVTLHGRSEIASAAAQVRTRLNAFKVEMSDVAIEVSEDRRDAVCFATAQVTVDGMGENDWTWRDFEFEWRKTEDGWRIAAVQTVETIRRPGQG